MLITPDLEFSRWVNVLHCTLMTAAMIDRLVHHGHLINFCWRMLSSQTYVYVSLILPQMEVGEIFCTKGVFAHAKNKVR